LIEKEKMATFPGEEIRVVIKFLWTQGKRPMEIVEEINSAARCGQVSRATVYKWVKRFEEGEWDCDDKERSGRPKKNDVKAMIERLLLEDPYQSARSLASALLVDKNTVCRVLRDEMNMKKVNAHWIPHELSDQQKMRRVGVAREMLHVLNNVRYFSTVLTGDETYLYWKKPPQLDVAAGRPPTSIKGKTNYRPEKADDHSHLVHGRDENDHHAPTW